MNTQNNAFGKKVWIFPDGDRPREGAFPLKGHESIIILNSSNQTAMIQMTIFFTDRDPVTGLTLQVDSQRVRCFKTNNLNDMCGVHIGYSEQYAIKLESDVEIVAQYGKLETSDQPMAYYTVMGYSI
jgi:hypothetical protein